MLNYFLILSFPATGEDYSHGPYADAAAALAAARNVVISTDEVEIFIGRMSLDEAIERGTGSGVERI
jgi:hypothetical protein